MRCTFTAFFLLHCSFITSAFIEKLTSNLKIGLNNFKTILFKNIAQYQIQFRLKNFLLFHTHNQF